jgi:glutathione reductase (NADPH)
MASSYDYDLFVIGAGSGGVRASRMAAQAGARVGICEDSRIGGTCVIRGCIPKKLLVYAAHYGHDFHDAVAYGWQPHHPTHDWGTLIANKDEEIDRLNGIYINLLKSAGVDIHEGKGRMVDAHTVRIGQKAITAETILIATGGWPFIPDIPGAEHAITSNEALDLKERPRRILIVGGGYIAVEFAGIFAGLGSEVTMVIRGEELLRGFDNDVRVELAQAMNQAGVEIHTRSNIASITKDRAGLTARTDQGADISADVVMFATGRAPNTRGIGLDDIGVKLQGNGAVAVDDYSRTNIPNIYAIGDVTDRVNLTPVAIREGMAFVETVFNGNPTPVDHDLIPTAIFTQPEMGTVGLSEEAARDQEPIEVYATSFRPMHSAFAGRPDRVLMKLIVSQATRKVLGCHIVAPGAGEMIQLAGIAVKMGATKEDFDRTVAVHPTMSEELVTMKTPVRTA